MHNIYFVKYSRILTNDFFIPPLNCENNNNFVCTYTYINREHLNQGTSETQFY